MRGLNAVLLKKLGAGIPEPAGADRLGDVARLAEVEAGGFHFAGLLFDVAPIWSDNHWRKGSSKILQPPRSESGLQAEKVPRRMWRRIVSV
jgi:hypothetical protein